MADQRWADLWAVWRTAAGWPEEGTFHALRHYFATTLIRQGWDPTDVQRALRHRNVKTTWDTYVHWWPKNERKRSAISSMLSDAARKRTPSIAQDQS